MLILGSFCKVKPGKNTTTFLLTFSVKKSSSVYVEGRILTVRTCEKISKRALALQHANSGSKKARERPFGTEQKAVLARIHPIRTSISYHDNPEIVLNITDK